MTFASCTKLAQGGQACPVLDESVIECGLPPGARQISAAEAILKGLKAKMYLSAYTLTR